MKRISNALRLVSMVSLALLARRTSCATPLADALRDSVNNQELTPPTTSKLLDAVPGVSEYRLGTELELDEHVGTRTIFGAIANLWALFEIPTEFKEKQVENFDLLLGDHPLNAGYIHGL